MANALAFRNLRLNLAAICTKKKITQRELARRAEVHFVTVNRIFQGVQEPTVGVAEKLAEAVGVPVEKIFSAPKEIAIAKRYRGR